VRVLVPMTMLFASCSSINNALSPTHQFYTESDRSFSESCSLESDRIKITEKLFSVGNTLCEIENFEGNHVIKVELKNCVLNKKPQPDKTLIIRTTYNATFIEGWVENPQKVYSCRIKDMVTKKNN